ncbi:hypothetical protein [Paenibacillus sp. 22594]|uniref:hypothetical protein n=1 Tax=Paenibacillus sp. 22594 TaxID=3453947 RepID=UPI003F85ED73
MIDIKIIPALLFARQLPRRTRGKMFNYRAVLDHCDLFTRLDVSFTAVNEETLKLLPYVENLDKIKKLLPLPNILLKPLLKLQTGYMQIKDPPSFTTDRIVFYLHGAEGLSEENTILHQLLIEAGYTIIRVSYHMDYEKYGLTQPKKMEDMPSFLDQLYSRIAPQLSDELEKVIEFVHQELGLTVENKEIIMIGHSLGAGVLLNYSVTHPDFRVNKFINLDGTMIAPALVIGATFPQLHLSQSQQFDASWLKEEETGSLAHELGKDYGMRIHKLLEASGSEYRWIQIAESTHFTFTDFPYLLKPYKFVSKIAGSRAASDRIRNYVLSFIEGGPSSIAVDPRDKEIIMDCLNESKSVELSSDAKVRLD